MERLTKRGHKFNLTNVMEGLNGYIEVDEILNRLAQYEDLEEQGLLMILPCKVGDVVYFADVAHPKAVIEEIKLSGRENEYCWVQYETSPETCELWDDGYFTDDEIGKTVFLTRAEAEEALKGGTA